MKLWRYIQGYRKGKEAHELEKEAMSDPFLAHALRGFDRVKGDHSSRIKELQKEIQDPKKSKTHYFRAVGIAASILVVFGLGTYFIVIERSVQDKNIPLAFQQESDSMEFAQELPGPAIARQRQVEKQVLHSIPEVEESIVEDNSRREKTVPAPEVPDPVNGKEMKIVVIESDEVYTADTAIEIQEDMELAAEQEEVGIIASPPQMKRTVTGAVANATGNKKVSGKVTDQQGEPLIGANVLVEGTNNGTVTDMDGYFELSVSDTSKIRVMYLGYENLEKIVGNNNVMNFAMNEDSSALDEVVVVGYGNKRQSVLQEPQPVGGMKKYRKYLKENIVKPTNGECSDLKGTVVLQFYVNTMGRPERITVQQSLCPPADQEAIRLLEMGPDWKQGDKEGTLQIKF